MGEATTIELASLPRRWFRIAAFGCAVLAVVMTTALVLSGAFAFAAFMAVFDLALAALAFGIARSIVVLGPGPTLAVTNGYRHRTITADAVERVDVVRANERSAPRRVSLSLRGGGTVQLLATDGAGRTGDAVEALAAQIEAFLHANGPT